MEEDKKKRYGITKITSVSISPLFEKFMSEYSISPTEALRRGIAVHLCDLGVGQYQSPKNEERAKFVNEFMKKLEADEKLRKDYNKVSKFLEIRKRFNEIKNIITNIEKEEAVNE